MKQLLGYLAKVSSLGIQKFIVNRKNLAVIILFEILDAIASILLIEVLYNNVSSIAGYKKYELYFLYGTNLCQLKIMMHFCIGGIGSFANKIISRDFDLVLLKPINTRLLMMIPDTNVHQLLSMSVAVYMVIYGLIHTNFVIGINILFTFIAFILGIILITNIFSIILSSMFWLLNASSLSDFCFILIGNANNPKGIYPKYVRLIFTFVFPVVLITNPCGLCLFAKENWQIILLLEAFYVCISEIVKRITWACGIKHYQQTL